MGKIMDKRRGDRHRMLKREEVLYSGRGRMKTGEWEGAVIQTKKTTKKDVEEARLRWEEEKNGGRKSRGRGEVEKEKHRGTGKDDRDEVSREDESHIRPYRHRLHPP